MDNSAVAAPGAPVKRRRNSRKLRVVDPVEIDAKRVEPVADEATLADTLADLASGMAAMLLPLLSAYSAMSEAVR